MMLLLQSQKMTRLRSVQMASCKQEYINFMKRIAAEKGKSLLIFFVEIINLPAPPYAYHLIPEKHLKKFNQNSEIIFCKVDIPDNIQIKGCMIHS